MRKWSLLQNNAVSKKNSCSKTLNLEKEYREGKMWVRFSISFDAEWNRWKATYPSNRTTWMRGRSRNYKKDLWVICRTNYIAIKCVWINKHGNLNLGWYHIYNVKIYILFYFSKQNSYETNSCPSPIHPLELYLYCSDNLW